MTTLENEIEQMAELGYWDFTKGFFDLPIFTNTSKLSALLRASEKLPPVPEFCTRDWVQRVDEHMEQLGRALDFGQLFSKARELAAQNRAVLTVPLTALLNERLGEMNKQEALAVLGVDKAECNGDNGDAVAEFTKVTEHELSIRTQKVNDGQSGN